MHFQWNIGISTVLLIKYFSFDFSSKNFIESTKINSCFLIIPDSSHFLHGQQGKQFITYINDVDVPKFILLENSTSVEFHGFADASEVAYGAVMYCKWILASGEFSFNLVASKSKVLTIKRLIIPKLELCVAVLLAKLASRVIWALKIGVDNIFLWTDSMIVFCWLQKEPCQLKTFVVNRIANIHKLTVVQ